MHARGYLLDIWDDPYARTGLIYSRNTLHGYLCYSRMHTRSQASQVCTQPMTQSASTHTSAGKGSPGKLGSPAGNAWPTHLLLDTQETLPPCQPCLAFRSVRQAALTPRTSAPCAETALGHAPRAHHARLSAARRSVTGR